MKKSNIALIGFRATGKTAVGRILAEKLQRSFIDMDERLTETFGCEIKDWVREHGWESFRNAESDLLGTLAGSEGLVIATGGGVAVRPSNRETLKNAFWNVWLKASADTIRARLEGDPKTESNRPPLTALPPMEEIEHLLTERGPFYRDAADLELETEAATAEELAEKIREWVRERLGES